jgi:hypothetical protein
MTKTPTKDIHEAALLLLDALRTSINSDEETSETLIEANDYLEKALLNYLAMMRTRPLVHAYEYLIPLKGSGVKPGWYWRHPKHEPKDWVNWHGPFASRKEAISARASQKGAPRTPLDVLERDIFT